MDRLPTRVNRADPEFSERKSFNLELIETLRERLDVGDVVLTETFECSADDDPDAPRGETRRRTLCVAGHC